MSKYVIRKYHVFYLNGNRDKVNLEMPIHTDDIEAVRVKLIAKHTGLGKVCKSVNFEYDEIWNDV